MEEVNRRKWRRLEHALEVEVRVQGAGDSIVAKGSHLSPEGIFVQLSEPPAVDTQVRVTIGGDGSASPRLVAEGMVISQRPPSDASNVCGVGIAFTDPGASWRMLYELLATVD